MTQGQFNWPGTTIQQMYDFMRDAIDPQSHQRALHWWDMPTSDVAHITKAVQAGYPVLITANEQNIIEKRTGARPYPWNLDATHVLPVVGIDKDGDFICADELNNNFQGYWPVVYLAQRINPIWATTVQVVGPDQNNPWLKPIPSADPTTWPSDFIAQTFGGAVQQTTPTDHVKQAFDTEWSSVVSGLDPNTGIAKAALVDYRAGNSHGPALTKEFKLNDWQGNVLTAQMLCSGVYMWDGQAHWHPFK